MFLTEKLTDMLKDIFFIDLLLTKKECINATNKFNNMKKCKIDFINEQIIKII